MTACLSLAAANVGCAAAQRPVSGRLAPLPRVVVLPAMWLTSAPRLQVDVEASAVQGLTATRGVVAESGARAAQALAAEVPGCPDDRACVRRVTRRLAGDNAVIVRLAELGDTLLVRISLADAHGGASERIEQRVLHSATAAAVGTAVREMTIDLARPLVPEPRTEQSAWYRRWWVWAGLSALTVAATGSILWVNSNDSEPAGPDLIVTPP
jgi:hypothetical protein